MHLPLPHVCFSYAWTDAAEAPWARAVAAAAAAAAAAARELRGRAGGGAGAVGVPADGDPAPAAERGEPPPGAFGLRRVQRAAPLPAILGRVDLRRLGGRLSRGPRHRRAGGRETVLRADYMSDPTLELSLQLGEYSWVKVPLTPASLTGMMGGKSQELPLETVGGRQVSIFCACHEPRAGCVVLELYCNHWVADRTGLGLTLGSKGALTPFKIKQPAATAKRLECLEAADEKQRRRAERAKILGNASLSSLSSAPSSPTKQEQEEEASLSLRFVSLIGPLEVFSVRGACDARTVSKTMQPPADARTRAKQANQPPQPPPSQQPQPPSAPRSSSWGLPCRCPTCSNHLPQQQQQQQQAAASAVPATPCRSMRTTTRRAAALPTRAAGWPGRWPLPGPPRQARRRVTP